MKGKFEDRKLDAHKVDDRYLNALIGSAGKSIASLPGAARIVARMKLAESPTDLAYVLQGVDLGLDERAQRTIWEAATDKDRWKEAHALLLRSAEQHLVDKFSASS